MRKGFNLFNINMEAVNLNQIKKMYHRFRLQNGNKKPNRAIVEMRWEDEAEKSMTDAIGIIPSREIGFDDCDILYYVASLKGLAELMKPNNGSSFIVDKVLGFYIN